MYIKTKHREEYFLICSLMKHIINETVKFPDCIESTNGLRQLLNELYLDFGSDLTVNDFSKYVRKSERKLFLNGYCKYFEGCETENILVIFYYIMEELLENYWNISSENRIVQLLDNLLKKVPENYMSNKEKLDKMKARALEFLETAKEKDGYFIYG